MIGITFKLFLTLAVASIAMVWVFGAMDDVGASPPDWASWLTMACVGGMLLSLLTMVISCIWLIP